MRAKRRLIDTPLASRALSPPPPPPAVSLSSTPTLSGLSSVVEHCLSLTANYSPTPNSSRSNFQNTVFLTVLRARIVAHLFLSRQSCRTGEGGGEGGTLLVASLCFQYYQCSLQINSQTTIAPVPPPRVLSVFTTDRVTKVQSQRAVSDLETALELNWKRVSPPVFFEPSVGRL